MTGYIGAILGALAVAVPMSLRTAPAPPMLTQAVEYCDAIQGRSAYLAGLFTCTKGRVTVWMMESDCDDPSIVRTYTFAEIVALQGSDGDCGETS